MSHPSGSLNLDEDFLETKLPVIDDYTARVTSNMNRQHIVLLELYTGEPPTLQNFDELFFNPNSDTEQTSDFSTTEVDTIVRITIGSVTGGTNGNISLEIDTEIELTGGGFPVDNG